MPVIRITEVTWNRLKQWAIPLEDSPEDAIKKLLDTAEEHQKCPKKLVPPPGTPPKTGGKLPPGRKLNEEAYRHPILEALNELGNSALAYDTLKVVEKKLRPLLTEFDYEKVPSGGDLRWRNTACFVRADLVREGLLKSDSPRGTWELSDKGKQWLSEQASEHRHDPKEDNPKLRNIFEKAEEEVHRTLADHPRGLGFCHTYWIEKKRILKEKYGIDWKSPAEMNPDVIFD